MEDPKERLTTSISTAELERRWKATREMMRAKKIDFLVMRQDEEFLGGYVRWFSDFSARHSYPFTVIFPSDEEMTFITCGGFPPAVYAASSAAIGTVFGISFSSRACRAMRASVFSNLFLSICSR